MQPLQSKLPWVGESIFSKMSRMALEEQALNLSQGFPEFQPPSELIEAIHQASLMGKNQYTPMPGTPELREAIALKELQIHQHTVNPQTEITVTPGATAGLYTAIQALIHPGDEAIIIEPAYDSYRPAIELAGGVCLPVQYNLTDFSFPWDDLTAAINEKTRLIIINTPHNPLGVIFSAADFDRLYQLIENTSIRVISDEVYEHIVFDGQTHSSILSHPGLKSRAVKVSSFGKTFHSTGWKMGYLMAPADITQEIRKVFQFLAFSVHSTTQFGLAQYMNAHAEWEPSLSDFYQKKRDLFIDALGNNTAFKVMPCQGSYFAVLNYGNLSNLSDQEFAEIVTRQFKLASIPINAFITEQPVTKLLRFCFAKNDDTLLKSVEILHRISTQYHD
ncbi:MAG: methionine aminotransferase [Bacteroidia bacterium]|nr:methionine aminotransferase [Bacteroidia bacterium]